MPVEELCGFTDQLCAARHTDPELDASEFMRWRKQAVHYLHKVRGARDAAHPPHRKHTRPPPRALPSRP